MPTIVEAAPVASAKGTVGTSETLTLADRLAQTADTRHGAIGETRNKHNVRGYNSSDWLTLMFSVRNRGLLNLWQPMLLVAICACVFTPVAVLYANDATCEALERGSTAFGLVLSALSFLLVFRLNRSATRHYEARQLCGWMMIHVRDVALSATTTLRGSPATRDRLCEVAVAFPVAFMLHLWGVGDPNAPRGAFAAMVEGVFADPSTLATITTAKHRPLALIEHAQSVLHEALGPGGTDLTHDDRRHDAPLEAIVYERLLGSIQGLGQPLGGCERIQGTPLPFVYVAHLRSFLLVVLCACPICFACEWQWATIPLSLLIAIALLGIEAASVECERPFSRSPSKNHHDLERFAVLLSTEVSHMLQRAEARAAGGAQHL